MISIDVSRHQKTVAIAEGRRHDLVSRFDRLAAFFLRGKTVPLRNARPMVSFTFDDIPVSAYVNGASILEEHGARGTFYVSGGLCGGRHPVWLFADEEAVSDIARRGHEIGCHTYSHKDIQQLKAGEFEEELRRNLKFLKSLEGNSAPKNFAYPYGSVGLMQKPLAQARFASCRGVREGINSGVVDLGHLRAVRLYDSTMTLERIQDLLEQTARERGWLIFYTHDVHDPPTDQGVSTALFRQALEAAARSECDIVTVGEALELAQVTNPGKDAVKAAAREARRQRIRIWLKRFWVSGLLVGGALALDAI